MNKVCGVYNVYQVVLKALNKYVNNIANYVAIH